MADKFDAFIDAVLEGAKVLAKDSLHGYQSQAAKDAKAFLKKAEADLKRWTKLLASGELTEQDFRDLVQAKEALAEIHALTQAGIALAELERFRSGLIELVVDKAFEVFL